MPNTDFNPQNTTEDRPDDLLDLVVPSRPAQSAAQPVLETDINSEPAEPSPKIEGRWRFDTESERLPSPGVGSFSGSAAALPLPNESSSAPFIPGPYSDDDGNMLGIALREMAETVVLAIVIFLVIRVGVQNYRIEGQSMEPNFHNGEYLLVNKLAYRLGSFERGDVIVFHYPNDPTKDYIKRVVGLPGDTVEIRDARLFVNNIAVEEPYAHMPMMRDAPPTLVEPDHLYVLGDNRPASADTRSWGLLDQELVIGQAWLTIYPLDLFGLVAHPSLDLSSAMANGP